MSDKNSDIQYRELSNNKPSEYFRKLSKDCPRLKYGHAPDMKYSGHWGQRKLLYTEIEFFSIASKFIDINKNNCLIVYIGAANGVRDNIYKTLFPNTQFLLYDPMPFAIKESEQFIIKTGKDGFFSDDTIQDVFDIAKGRKLLYICDIRSDTSESAIWDNMAQQQRWGIKMGVELMMLKLRFPYTYIKEHGKRIDTIIKPYDLNEIKNNIVIINEQKTEKELLYLHGNIYIQLHAPYRSTETRLITGKIKYMNKDSKYDKDDEKYALKYYDSDKYEEQMNYFNTNYRLQTYSYKNSMDTKNHIIGFDDGYDMTGEYVICDKYFKYYKKEEYDHKKIIKLLNEINIFMSNITNVTSLVTFPINSYALHYQGLEGNEKVKYLRKVIELAHRNAKSYEKQKEIVLNSKILSDKELSQQMKIYDNKRIKIKGIPLTIKFRNGKIDVYKDSY